MLNWSAAAATNFGANTSVWLADPGPDVDDSLAILAGIHHAFHQNKKMLIVLGANHAISADLSFELLQKALTPETFSFDYQAFIHTSVQFVRYADWIDSLYSADAPMHYGTLALMSPQTADLPTIHQDMLSQGLPNLQVNFAFIQGNMGSEKHLLGNHFDTDQSGTVGVNVIGNEALARRLQDEGKLVVVDSAQCLKFKPNSSNLRVLPKSFQNVIYSTAIYQMFSRAEPTLPFAAGLISDQIGRGTNYIQIASLYESITTESLNTIDVSDIPSQLKQLADDYIEALKTGLQASDRLLTDEQICDLTQKLYRIVLGLNQLVPDIWHGREQLFINLDLESIESDPTFTPVFEMLATSVQQNKAGFAAPWYDLYAFMAYQEVMDAYARTKSETQADAEAMNLYEALPSNFIATCNQAEMLLKFEQLVQAIYPAPTSASSTQGVFSLTNKKRPLLHEDPDLDVTKSSKI
ncbi:MAG: hypothetical protein QNK11_03215 [Legionella sp.]|nr:hypothetical protein [Legionella sp.]